jgi:hypothetical protein
MIPRTVPKMVAIAVEVMRMSTADKNAILIFTVSPFSLRSKYRGCTVDSTCRLENRQVLFPDVERPVLRFPAGQPSLTRSLFGGARSHRPNCAISFGLVETD